MDMIKEGLDIIIEELENNTENGVSFIWKGTVPKSILDHPQLKVEMVTRNISHITVVEVNAIDFENTNTRRSVKQFFRLLTKIKNSEKHFTHERFMQKLNFEQSKDLSTVYFYKLNNDQSFNISFTNDIMITFEDSLSRFKKPNLKHHSLNVDCIYSGNDFEQGLKELINYCLLNGNWRKGK